MKNPVDQKERNIIKNDLNKNIFVEAGAGSGKTRSLVDRMVAMVKSGIDVSKICAITFTKAAAVEFYNRFETKLSEEINSNISDQEKKLCQSALLNIDLCFMGTIDAFCNMILSENPIEAGIPLNSSIVSEDEYNFRIGEEYYEILKNIKSGYDKDLLDNFLRFQSKPKEAFVYCVRKLLSKRNYRIDVKNLNDIQKREQTFYKTYQDEIRTLISSFLADDGEGMYESSIRNKDAKQYIINNSRVIYDDWSKRPTSIISFFENGLADVNINLNFTKMTGEFYDYFDAKTTYYILKPNKAEEVFGEYRSIQYEYTLAFVKRFLDQVSESLIKKGKLSFFDNLLLFKNLLQNDAAKGGESIKHITERHEYFLIDEFQDTDPIQAEIFFFLTAEKPNPDFTLCKPKPGRLFIVGDPKQSIYRFRNADVVSYKKIKELFIKNKDEFLELTTNFRSCKKLIDYYNAQFKITFKNTYGGLQAPFTSVNYYDDGNNKSYTYEGVYKYSSTYKEDAKNVANLINNLIKKGYKYKDIMVLTGTTFQLSNYIEEFDEKSIPCEIAGQSAFNGCEVFINLVYILGALANPKDSYYVYKAYKHIYKISDSHIYSVFKDNGPSLSKEVNDQKLDKLINFYFKNKDENIMIIVNRVIEEFDLLKNSSTKHLEYLYYAKELLRSKVAEGSVVTIKEAYEYLKNLVDSDSVERCLSLSQEKNTDNGKVSLANVHKVKGLESKIVILTCNASKVKDPTGDVEIHSSYKDKSNCVIKLSSKDDNFIEHIYAKSNDFTTEATDEGEALLCERDRIAYVAATRACEALFISSDSIKDKKPKNPWGVLLKEDAALECIDDADDLIEGVKPVAKNNISVSSLTVDVLSVDDKTIDKTYRILSPSKTVEGEKEDVKYNEKGDTEATLKGSIVHRLLELYVSSGYKDALDTYLTIINNEYMLDSKYNDLLKKVFETMKNGGFEQDSNKVKDLIAELKSAQEVYTELPFAYKEGNDIYNGIIDLLYKKQDKWYIVDYKTNYDAEELDAKYTNQLEGYKKALACQGIEADAFIYHIDIK